MLQPEYRNSLGAGRSLKLVNRGAPEGANELDCSAEGGVILVVDDMAGNRRLHCHILRSLGLRSESVENGAQALEYLTQQRPRLVLLDIDMPVLNGRELLERLKLVEQETVPAVAVITSAPREDNLDLLEFPGVVDVVRKPMTRAKILELLRQSEAES